MVCMNPIATKNWTVPIRNILTESPSVTFLSTKKFQRIQEPLGFYIFRLQYLSSLHYLFVTKHFSGVESFLRIKYSISSSKIPRVLRNPKVNYRFQESTTGRYSEPDEAFSYFYTLFKDPG
jgi:hypothetical protein